jgi:hypothetical protein
MMPGMKRTGITYGFASTIFRWSSSEVSVASCTDHRLSMALLNEHGIGFGHSLRYE